MTLNRSRSYIDSPHLIKYKKATINSINKYEDKYFQYAAAVLLNQKYIGKKSRRVKKSEPFTEKNNLKGITFPSVVNNREKIIKQLL